MSISTRCELRVLVLFHSWTGNTKSLADAAASGAATNPDVSVEIRRVPELRDEKAILDHPHIGAKFAAVCAHPVATASDFAAADVVLLGCPTRMGTMSAEMKRFIDDLSPLWQAGALEGKVGAAFTTASTLHGGVEMTLMSLTVAMVHFGMIIVSPGFTARVFDDAGSPYGASSTTKIGGLRVPPTSLDIEAAQMLGRRAAQIGQALKAGRFEQRR